MIKKIIFTLILFMFFLITANCLAEKVNLISYYPAPFGAYKQITVGQGVIQPSTDNKTTLMRIGVINVDKPADFTYVPSLLEVGGPLIIPNQYTSAVSGSIGIASVASIGIVAISNSNNKDSPAIYALKSPNSTGNAIMAFGADVGVQAEGNNLGVKGKVTVRTDDSENQGEEQCGIWGECNPSITSGAENDKFYGVKGVATKGNTDAIAYGVYGDGNNYGVYGTCLGTTGHAIHGEGGEYAGYFNGDVYIKGRADPETLNIPVLDADPANAVNGDLYFNTGSSKLRIYIGGWKDVYQINNP